MAKPTQYCSLMVFESVAWSASLPGRRSTWWPGLGYRMKQVPPGTSCLSNCRHPLWLSVTARKVFWCPFLGTGQVQQSSAATSTFGRTSEASSPYSPRQKQHDACCYSPRYCSKACTPEKRPGTGKQSSLLGKRCMETTFGNEPTLTTQDQVNANGATPTNDYVLPTASSISCSRTASCSRIWMNSSKHKPMDSQSQEHQRRLVEWYLYSRTEEPKPTRFCR